jgi:hypothetical protein
MTTTESVPPRHRRPIPWIALSAVLGVCVIVLGLKAMSLDSELNTATSELATTKTALAAAEAEADKKVVAGAVVATALGAGVAALQDHFGLTPVAAGTVQQQLADAQQRGQAAAAEVADATGAAKTRAQAKAASIKSSIAVTCARAAADVFGSLSSGSGDLRARATAVVDELKALGPQCKTALAQG